MICAVSPASSCRTETLSTLRFAQRAEAIQNKAVINEEANDVNLLREQIRQLKPTGMELGSTNVENLTKGVLERASNGDLEAECTLVSPSTARLQDTDAGDAPNIVSHVWFVGNCQEHSSRLGGASSST